MSFREMVLSLQLLAEETVGASHRAAVQSEEAKYQAALAVARKAG